MSNSKAPLETYIELVVFVIETLANLGAARGCKYFSRTTRSGSFQMETILINIELFSHNFSGKVGTGFPDFALEDLGEQE
jgi:hypothetical protein